MSKQLVLFAGLHKTGSTSIQETCARNQRAIIDAGYSYPVVDFKGGRHINHTALLNRMFRKEPNTAGYSRKTIRYPGDTRADTLAKYLNEAVATLLKDLPTNLLMVAEGASLLTVDELQKMKVWFSERGFAVRVVCHVRWLSSWINSMVSQRITGHRRMFLHMTIRSAVDEFMQTSGIVRPRIMNLKEAFPDAEFYSYEAALKHRFGPVGFFFQTIGIDQAEKMTVVRANEGRSDCATRLLSSINETLGRTAVGGEKNQQLMDSDISGLQAIPGPKFALREDEAAPLLPVLAAENEWLKETLGEEFYDRRLVFRSEPCAWSNESLKHLREVSSTAAPVVRRLISDYLAKLEPGNPARTRRGNAPGVAPDQPAAHLKRGLALAKLKRLDEALGSYDRAIALNPDYAEAHFRRGKALRGLRRLDESLTSHDRAIALNPDYAAAYFDRGIVLCDLKRLEESVASLDRVIALRPESVAAYVNRALVLGYLRRFDEALADCERAIALKPDFADAYWRKSDLKLLLGDYREGWQLHEWRWKSKPYENAVRRFDRPLWIGEQSVAGKVLLIHAEAGLGDTIQFCRYVPMVRGLGANVCVEVPASLASLVSTLNGDFTVVTKGNPLPDFDLHCPMMSLPLALRTTVETIPAAVPYLHADPDKQKIWRRQLGNKTRPRIGLAWSGHTGRAMDLSPCRKRNFELQLLEPLLQLPMEFHSLQKDLQPGDADVLAKFEQVHAHQEDLNDFSDTAALIQELDLVVSIDTSVAHLAGALGKPVWILLPHSTDYRWMLDRTDSPWYPTATLFRQLTIGDWSGVISQVVQRLGETKGRIAAAP